MPFTMVGWSESQDSAVLVNAAALADPHITVSGDDIRVPDWASLMIAAHALGLNLTRAQIVSPTLRRVLNIELGPLDRATLPTFPSPTNYFLPDGIELVPDESINVQVAEDAAGAGRVTVLALLADGPVAPIGGTIYQVRFTAATAAVAFAWTNMAITFDQSLQPGEYACVGAMVRSTTGIAFRFVVPGAYHRPGSLMGDAVGDLGVAGSRRGGWGEWFRFRHTVPPTIDVLAGAADAAFTGEMDLIYLG